MALPNVLEVERLMNLIRNFGWEKKSEVVEADKLIITIQKAIEPKPIPRPG